MRHIVGDAPKGITRDSALRDEERVYRFVTPVFGGGVRIKDHHKPHDERTPIRVPSVRGQLRFWWRAVNPRGCRDVRELREAEARVFGSAAGGETAAGTLDVSVMRQPSDPRDKAVLEDGNSFRCMPGLEGLAYGAFPLRDTDRQRNVHGKLHEYAGDWALRLRYGAAIAEDVAAALWAWAHFGGLGGRTRRGFGAIRQVSPGLPAIADGWARWVKTPAEVAVPWPHLARERAGVTAEGNQRASGPEAHEALLRLMRDLRQGPLGRNPRSSRAANRPGRSYWPEPDVIRAEARITAGPHGTPISGVPKLPRAMFGMPIITHFKEERGEPHEPRDSTMVPKVGNSAKTRWASPLLLRPLCLGERHFVPFALRLRQTEPDTIVLQGIQGARDQSPRLTAAERHLLQPFRGAPATTDVIDLYLHLLRTR